MPFDVTSHLHELIRLVPRARCRSQVRQLSAAVTDDLGTKRGAGVSWGPEYRIWPSATPVINVKGWPLNFEVGQCSLLPATGLTAWRSSPNLCWCFPRCPVLGLLAAAVPAVTPQQFVKLHFPSTPHPDLSFSPNPHLDSFKALARPSSPSPFSPRSPSFW